MTSIPSWFRRGADVVYIGVGWRPVGYKGSVTVPLEKGETYVIRQVVESPRSGLVGCYLRGIYNDFHPTMGLECGYIIYDFSPPISTHREADTRLFNSLLNTTPLQHERETV